ncbi:MAG: malto-oligosyltrehalose synthase, partial [Candidatus Rokubacteria bacterium]|nr:malto-oligosyltrehalose synthase [Candidatus Rokubacteria bacterium]
MSELEPDRLLDEARRALAREHRATYRLQLGRALGFDGVAELVPYLDALGISDVYLSPCFKATPGSPHGYDVTDHNALNPELGGEAGFQRMAAAIGAAGLGLLLDVVPNHMGVAGDSNPWWTDVLENGAAAPTAVAFDIDWAPAKAELRDKVLLPFLPDQYGRVLEAQELRLELVEGALFVRHGGGSLPLDPSTYHMVLGHGLDALAERLGAEHASLLELQSILTALENLPPRTETDPARVAVRLREKEIVKRRLAALLKESAEIAEFVADSVHRMNGTRGDPRSFDRLDQLLSAQVYRLADWRVAGDEVNYRRFFDVNELAAIRMEVASVFEATHRLVFRLIGEGTVTGLRIDHPDGLFAPGEYFRRLHAGAVEAVARRLHPGLTDDQAQALRVRYLAVADETPAAPRAEPLWLVVEKILLVDERVPDWWPIAGTTGYSFLASANRVLVDRSAARRMTAVYSRFIGETPAMADLAYAAKRLIMVTSMAGEVSALGRELNRLSEMNRLSRDFTLPILTRALREVIACFPVYRTYVGDRGEPVSPRDRSYIEAAVAEAKRRNPQINVSIFDFLADTLLLRAPEGASAHEVDARRRFVMRFQQTTGPVTAKGVEDTALYQYHRLVSLNEVGNDPDHFGDPPAAFHASCAARPDRWPEALLATSTHDTKRGEDVRARISVLSEVPQAWGVAVSRWRRLARGWKSQVDGRLAPDRPDEYLLYQTLVGTWPLDPAEATSPAFAERIAAYMGKAIREAKRHTSWINPHPAYDRAMRDFVMRVLAPGSALAGEIGAFQSQVAPHGMLNSLATTLLKLAAPGIPDFYQGSELWHLVLVDPDNRGPVDFGRRRALLDELRDR